VFNVKAFSFDSKSYGVKKSYFLCSRIHYHVHLELELAIPRLRRLFLRTTSNVLHLKCRHSECYTTYR